MASQRGSGDPAHVSEALRQLIAARGFARQGFDEQLRYAWQSAVGEAAQESRPQRLQRGVLHVAVGNAPLLSELANFRKPEILAWLQKHYPEWRLKDLRFRLEGRTKDRN